MVARVISSERHPGPNQPIVHSPGPWVASQGTDDDEDRWAVLREEAPQFFIAVIENGAPGDTLETERATAILIAAAPEMLEFLREVALPPYQDSDVVSLLKTLQVRAKTLIEKATGSVE